MARDTSEARRMGDAFAAANLPLHVAYYRRGLPRFVEAKAMKQISNRLSISEAL